MTRPRATAYYIAWIMWQARATRGFSLSFRRDRDAFRREALRHHAPERQRRRLSSFSLFSSSSTDNKEHVENRKLRLESLHEYLSDLGIDAKELENAAFQSIEDPTGVGYDGRFGKSAIKTYRAFVDPKQSVLSTTSTTRAAAARCARQVDFLIKRHKSHEAEWVRHTDVLAASSGAAGERRTFPLTLVLDNVRSAFNVGSLFRTADACGCSEVITTGITPHPKGSGADKLTKSALGADRLVPSRHFRTTLDAIQTLRNEKPAWMLIGMETTERSTLYTDMTYPDKANAGTVLVLGNEVTGVDTDILPLLDHVVEIPMFGAKNSLNIAACAPVVLYEILRQWNATADDIKKA